MCAVASCALEFTCYACVANALSSNIFIWKIVYRLISFYRHLFVDNITVSLRKFSVSFAGQLAAKSQNRAEWVRVVRSCRYSGNRSAVFKETSQFNDPAGLGTDE